MQLKHAAAVVSHNTLQFCCIFAQMTPTYNIACQTFWSLKICFKADCCPVTEGEGQLKLSMPMMPLRHQHLYCIEHS